MSREIGVYVHIPFCTAKCNYCDFNSYGGKCNTVEPYVDAILDEIVRVDSDGRSVSSVFIGGGTPSLIDSVYIEKILVALREKFKINEGAEISIESNPGTLSKEKLNKYREIGINRISIGLQAWQENLLSILGRIHSAKKFVESFEMARNAGFDNINVDLIFGIPGQSVLDWKETLEEIVKLDPEHISCYSLKIEEDTPFGEMYKRNEIDYLDESIEREMYYNANEYLNKHGFVHYEISNYAKKGYNCKHNEMYWNCGEYIGFGSGSHSYYKGNRFGNVAMPEDYIESIQKGQNPVDEESRVPIDIEESMSEFMILGLRLIDGVKFLDFSNKFNKDARVVFGDKIEALVAKGLIELDDIGVRVTKLGLDFANNVFMEFLQDNVDNSCG